MNVQHFFRPGEEFCKEPLFYKDCGLDNIILKNGFTVETIDGEDFLTVSDLDGLHRAIGLHIVLNRKAPSGKELRFLRGELQMSQADLARVLDVSDQSVARWEKGQSEANGAAVFGLRMIYLLSLTSEKKRSKIMSGIIPRLRKLMQSDETTENIVLFYTGDKWQEPERRRVNA